MYKLKIIRYSDNGKQTDGYAILMDADCNVIFACLTLELPWKNNANNISCIPEGEYIAEVHNSPNFGKCLWLKEVEDRSEILIHPANYVHQLRGCIALGNTRLEIDNDGQLDVSQSRKTVNQLLNLIPLPEVMVEISKELL